MRTYDDTSCRFAPVAANSAPDFANAKGPFLGPAFHDRAAGSLPQRGQPGQSEDDWKMEYFKLRLEA